MERQTIRFDGRQSLDSLPEECWQDCSAQGSVDESVDYWFRMLDIQARPELIREHLSGYGAWDSEELADDDENKKRLIFVWANGIKEAHYEHNRKIQSGDCFGTLGPWEGIYLMR